MNNDNMPHEMPKEIREEMERLADAYTFPNWPKKSDWDRQERYSTLMQYEIAYIVEESFEDGFTAAYTIMAKRVEALEKSNEYLRAQFKDECEHSKSIKEPLQSRICELNERIAELEAELECAERNLVNKSGEIGRAEHRGNTVDYIYDKCKNYGDQLIKAGERIAELESAFNLKNDEYVQQVGTWKIIQRLEEQNAALTEALRFYADNQRVHLEAINSKDVGARARAALEGE